MSFLGFFILRRYKSSLFFLYKEVYIFSNGQTTKPQHSSPFIHVLYYCPPDRQFFTQERQTLNKQEVQAARPLYGFKKNTVRSIEQSNKRLGKKKITFKTSRPFMRNSIWMLYASRYLVCGADNCCNLPKHRQRGYYH